MNIKKLTNILLKILIIKKRIFLHLKVNNHIILYIIYKYTHICRLLKMVIFNSTLKRT